VAPAHVRGLLRDGNHVVQEDHFMLTTFILTAAQVAPSAAPSPAEEPLNIVVTASLTPVAEAEAPASVTVIDREQIEALGLAQATDLIRYSPGVAVSVFGGQGTQAQVRIRGAEVIHSLLFIDGITFNDLASNNQARFETVTAAGLERLELIRGPQSALWGSEALGGVIAIETPRPLGRLRGVAEVEAGSLDSQRLSAALASGGENFGVSGTIAWGRSDGIDILGGGTGDLDGYENLTASLKAVLRSGDFEAGAVGRYIDHEVAFDSRFPRGDSGHVSQAETSAGRVWVGYGDDGTPWQARVEAQHLDSVNRNRRDNVRTNDSYGRRSRFGAQLLRRIEAGSTRHTLIAAAEREEEKFGTRDLEFDGSSDRDLDRSRTAFVGEWRAHWGDWLTTDLALRHDDFSRFEDATTFRAQAEARLGGGFSILASYGEGIAQPSFVDLFGFGPASRFIGNPDLRPERSEGYELGVRWQRPGLKLEAVAFSSDLTDEIVEDFSIFPDYTVVNAAGESRRRGIELSAEWQPAEGLSLAANYTYLDADQPDGTGTVREIRRAEHSANLYGNWRRGPLTVGLGLSYVGERTDQDFDLFPAPTITLGDYVLASARVAYRLNEHIEAFGRIENGFDERYEDVIGYATPGRTVYAGLRLLLGR
jgi:vitamin B12 transporter